MPWETIKALIPVIAAMIVVVIIAGLGVGWKLERNSHLKTQNELATVVAAVKQETKRQKDAKKKADAKNVKLRASLELDNKRLRDKLTNFDATGGAGSSEQACYDRPKLERAIRSFVEGTGKLIERGASSEVDLNSAKQWAQD